MKSCWFAGVKCDMKAEGVTSKEEDVGHKVLGGGAGEGGGGDLIGDGLWYCYDYFSLENYYFTVLWLDFSAGAGYLGNMMGTV